MSLWMADYILHILLLWTTDNQIWRGERGEGNFEREKERERGRDLCDWVRLISSLDTFSFTHTHVYTPLA